MRMNIFEWCQRFHHGNTPGNNIEEIGNQILSTVGKLFVRLLKLNKMPKPNST